MTLEQSLIRTALRRLGNPHSWTWHDVREQLHGVCSAANGILLADQPGFFYPNDLDLFYKVARHLSMEELTHG